MDPIMIEYLVNMVLNPHHKNWEGGTLVEHIFLSCLLAQQVRCYVANIIWQLFAKRGNSSHQKSFSMMQCLLHQALCKTLKLFIAPSWGVSSHGILTAMEWFGFWCFSMTCGEVTPRCVGLLLLDYERIEWQQTLTNLGKASDMAYQDVLEEFNLVWCVKSLLATCNNLTVI